VEFGAKVNTWQVDGLNFIEHFSFSAFHEGNRLKQGVAFHHKHFGKLKQLGADAIYATNENRRYITKLGIATLEGSYGNDKNHYTLRKVKARTELTEIAWIFFGMMTANAVKMAKRKMPKPQIKAPPEQLALAVA